MIQGMISVRYVPGKGRGVFAQKQFAKNEVIERAPVIVLPTQQEQFLDQTALKDYYYYWNAETVAVALGFGSLYNHAYTPNACYVRKYAADVMEFIALRTIAIDEEITINYNGDPADQAPVWFHVIG
jgi:SET domain-containing protein